MRIALLGMAMLAGLVFTGPAVAAPETAPTAENTMVNRLNPQLLAAALDRFNLTYEQRRNSNGDPLIVVREGDLVHEQGMAVIFYGCEENNECETASFYTFFKTATPLEAEVYHYWNDIFRVRTWTKAFEDSDGDTGFVMNVSAVGGVGTQSMEFLTGLFLTEMNAFRNALMGVRNGTMASTDLAEPETWTDLFSGTFSSMAMMGENSEFELQNPSAPKALMTQP